ncbi:hypothetical protein DPMN_146210 [Dreissena polymorpha]|uniref:Sushi domain-containing protein n=1 Tax=Dreissena polymorpha TaxID=45954 RepID=A0A9D4IY79_DREPO|nr:hypothetical protein DPMN_146210 [Dreissena polymorpha]
MFLARSCGHPGDIENGWRTGYAFTYPNRVNYYCHEGFLPHGANFRDCQANGTWAGQVPKCERELSFTKHAVGCRI